MLTAPGILDFLKLSEGSVLTRSRSSLRSCMERSCSAVTVVIEGLLGHFRNKISLRHVAEAPWDDAVHLACRILVRHPAVPLEGLDEPGLQRLFVRANAN